MKNNMTKMKTKRSKFKYNHNNKQERTKASKRRKHDNHIKNKIIGSQINKRTHSED